MRHRGVVSNPPHGLVQVGPIVNVVLTPHPSVTAAALAQGQQPTAQIVPMMIDTGAQRTVIERSLAQQLGLTPTRFQKMVGVSQIPEDCPAYMIGLRLDCENDAGARMSITFGAEVIGMNSPSHPTSHRGLLGRDFLAQFRLCYDGPSGTFFLEVPPQFRVQPGSALNDAEVREQAKEDKAKKRAERKAKKEARRKNR